MVRLIEDLPPANPNGGICDRESMHGEWAATKPSGIDEG